MNGFADRGLDESAFGEKKGLSEGIRSFDAFRKSSNVPLLPGFVLRVERGPLLMRLPLPSKIPSALRTIDSKVRQSN